MVQRKLTNNLIKSSQKGFTLIELLVVIGILAILLAITLIAINPARQFSQANNTKRASDVNSILDAIDQYMADNKGTLPSASINATAQTINGATFSDLCTAVVPTYIAALPTDPLSNNTAVTASACTSSTTWTTGYTVQLSNAGGNRVTVAAPGAELGATISVTR